MIVPSATYRLQFSRSFNFRMAQNILPYLEELGISHIYASPIFKSAKGSAHGYDVVDHNSLNPELGSGSDFDSFIESVRHCGMYWLQDIVPNHMAFDYDNKMLIDVLEKGQRSKFFSFFDIDWDHAYENIKGRVLAPFLGKFYGETLENGEISLCFGPEGFSIRYYNFEFPVAIDSYSFVLSHRIGVLRRTLGEDNPDFIKILGVLYALKSIVAEEEPSEVYNQVRFVKKMLWDIYSENEGFKRFLDASITIFNGNKNCPETFGLLDELLSKQVFRLSYWKIATKEINYRRFFNINSLISLMVQEEEVFNHIHDLLFQLVRAGKISGLRIDHADGLNDPGAYVKLIRTNFPEVYILVEKILAPCEDLPESWPVQGTTGYEFVNYVNGLFIDRKNNRAFTKIYSNFTATKINFADLVRDKKRLIILELMAGDVNNLAQELKSISSHDRHASDVTLYGLRRALTEVLVSFPVYRSYISWTEFTESDRKYIETAVSKAVQHVPALASELNFIKKFLLLQFPKYIDEEGKREWIKFAMRFQQYTSPVMAMGLEDTVLYVYNRLISLNEVGSQPENFGCSVSDFHRFNKKRLNSSPLSLNATSTHDTKRDEDIRARINVLSEIPHEWETTVKRWAKLNRPKKKRIARTYLPDRNDEYFLYQTLLGALPLDHSEYPKFVDRIKDYAIKAVREAKVHTAWVEPDIAYETAYASFIESILETSEDNIFFKDLLAFVARIARFGMLNSLSQTLLKITAPGVPDFYQGTEMWGLNLVDPDNRRPVDFRKRMRILNELRGKAGSNLKNLLDELLSELSDGRIKLFLIWRAMRTRRAMSELFQSGDYVPVKATGTLARHVVAFARVNSRNWSITVTPRLCTRLVPDGSIPIGTTVWKDTELVLPRRISGACRNAVTGEELEFDRHLALPNVFESFPVALLVN
ncbi:MAG: malto-oligosyltrehalose synthase [Deltaproteobacteria bacterium]|nr:malto-oligosyltrehalose synthase [Deltaproteobacteria bacterium]